MWFIWALSMKIRSLINPVRMRSSAVSMAPRRPAEWVDSSTSDSGPSATQPEHISPVYPCYFRRRMLTIPSCFFFFLIGSFYRNTCSPEKLRDGNSSLCEEGDVVVKVSHSWSKVDWFVNLTQNECKPTHGLIILYYKALWIWIIK